jgi:chromosome segregation ATPase
LQESFDNLEVQADRMQRQAQEEITELQHDLKQMTDRASEAALMQAKATTQAHMAEAALGRASDRLAVLEAELDSVKAQCEHRIATEQKAFREEVGQLRQRITDQAREAADKIAQLTEALSGLRAQLAEAESAVEALNIEIQQK